jgi:hypothetical protein
MAKSTRERDEDARRRRQRVSLLEHRVLEAASEVARYFEVDQDGQLAERMSEADGRVALAELVAVVELLKRTRDNPDG